MSFKAEIIRCVRKGDKDSWMRHLLWLLKFHAWKRRTRVAVSPAGTTADVTAIILAYKRPQNVDALVRSLLHTPSIRTVLVSNNNSSLSLRRWMSVRDPRVHVLEQVVDRRCEFRFELARRDDSDLFLAIDDDLFLSPFQLEQLISHLRCDPSRVHGMVGEVFDSWVGITKRAPQSEMEVDTLNRVYAFTREHVERFFTLLDLFGYTPSNPEWFHVGYDDILISSSGIHRPMMHSIGTFLDCPTHSDRSVAGWRQDAFSSRRVRLFSRILKQRTIDPPSVAS